MLSRAPRVDSRQPFIRRTMMQPAATAQRRNKCFDDSHQEMIETAVRLISEKGVDSLSIVAVARAMGINRTTVYYHFDSREALVAAVKIWSSEQLAKAFGSGTPQQERIDYISRFVLNNPELIKLWIEDFISSGDIRDRYPHWDALVQGIRASAAAEAADETVDAEVYCTILLTSAFIAPRVFKNSVCPKEDTETIVRRFRHEHQRLLKYLSLLKP
jgi:AcrR family transcriptional regulator